jgi:hypothetical protein
VDLVAFVNKRLLEDDELEPGLVVHDPADLQRPPGATGAARPVGNSSSATRRTRNSPMPQVC